MDTTYLLTPLGIICQRDDLFSLEMQKDLGLSEPVARIGPFAMCTLSLNPLSLDQLTLAAIGDCYVAAHGCVMHCSTASRLRQPVTRILAAFRAGRRVLICCDYAGTVRLKDRGAGGFRLERLADVPAGSVRVLETFAGTHESNIVLEPSAEFVERLKKSCHLCLTDGEGWVIVDSRS
ncbi:conserved hypothetical pox protein [Squirrelpox virus]|uniref:C2R n=1 Tax=Squirrelpox virus TaxID=240426 RepID=Q1HTR1_9POXV|nr:conserved hypothetical pox protein [Squirrelpox virus]ABD51475.1 C2R [Squirrelpox virus]CCD83307.1 conserved hypothetical pox protein [Squirrelpox virus]